MPLEFNKIKNLLAKKEKPKHVGEEGIINLVSSGLGDQRKFFAKQWYAGNDLKGLASKIESGESPCSPYWVKLKFYEYALIHEIFPDITLSVAGAYDPRITKEEDGTHHFSYQAGRPVTISRIVEGDPEEKSKRDEVINKGYNALFKYREDTNHEIHTTQADRKILYEVVGRVDKEMQDMFGRELSIPKFDAALSANYVVDNLLKEARTINPNSPMVKLLEFGIVPIHPEFNFIPNKQDDNTEKPQGVFIELSLMDLDRFLNSIEKEFGEKKLRKIDDKGKRFMIYEALDEAYDMLMSNGYMYAHFLPDKASRDHALKFGSKVQDAVFELFELIRTKYSDDPENFSKKLAFVVREVQNLLNNKQPEFLPESISILQNSL